MSGDRKGVRSIAPIFSTHARAMGGGYGSTNSLLQITIVSLVVCSHTVGFPSASTLAPFNSPHKDQGLAGVVLASAIGAGT